ncbi:MAG: hypothetical protein WAV11_03390 [Minisyncoccia bacterium]
MGKRGTKPKNKVKIKWSGNFAYAMGLIATDGNLSPDGRHINFTSKDIEQIANFMKALEIECNIGKKSNGHVKHKKYFVIQFGDVNFYSFLNSIGLKPNKSKTIGSIKLPSKYFFDFLRGCFDGDGCFYSYWDKRWKSSFMFYTEFVSASQKHILWLQDEIFRRINIKGHITKGGNNSCYQLKYAKSDSLKLLKKIYYKGDLICLDRKKLKIRKILGNIAK